MANRTAEIRTRNKAKRLGLVVHGAGLLSPKHPGYGMWTLSDSDGNVVRASDDLADLERYLDQNAPWGLGPKHRWLREPGSQVRKVKQ